MMKSSIEEFIKELQQHKRQSGRVLQEMIDQSNRLLLNMPFFGIARKISSQLQDESFSDFYTFERTLSHKLHPELYKNNLNILSNSRIEKVFKKKYAAYRQSLPENTIKKKGSSPEDNLQKLNSLRDVILHMETMDGNFMVIKFCDYILSGISPDLAKMIRSAEFTMNLTRKQFTDDDDFNFNIYQNRYNDFKERFGEEFSEIFITRTTWDSNLKKYASMLSNRDSNKSGKERTEKSKNLIKEYANRVKLDYLDKTGDDNEKRIRKIIETVHLNNCSKFGKTTGDEIIKDILSCWLDDPDISDEKKSIMENFLNELFPPLPHVNEEAEDKELMDMNFPEEDDEDDNEAGEFDIDYGEIEDQQLTSDQFDTTDDNTGGSENSAAAPENNEDEALTINDRENTASDIHDISENSEVTSEEENIVSGEKDDISGEEADREQSPEEKQEEELRQLLNGKKEKLNEIDIQIEEAVKSAGAEVEKLLEIENPVKLSALASQMFNNEIYESYHFRIQEILHQREEENLFIKIIRYLETNPFPTMNTSEKIALIDIFIDKYRDKQKLVTQLENYKKSIRNTRRLLEEVYGTLSKIEKDYPGIKRCNTQQLLYLEKFLANKDFQPVWKTVSIIYDNIVNQMKEDTPIRIKERISDFQPVSRVKLLHYLQDFYRENREIKKEFKTILKSDDLASIDKRLSDEEEGTPVDTTKLFKEIMNEELSPSKWIEKIVKSEDDTNIKSESIKEGGDSDETAENTPLSENPETEEEQQIPDAADDLKEFITDSDLSTEENFEELTGKISRLIEINPQKAAEDLETIVCTSGIDPVVQEVVLQVYKNSRNPILEKIYMAHRMIESTVELSGESIQIEQIKKVLEEEGVPVAVIKSLDHRLEIQKDQGKKTEAVSGLIAPLEDMDAEEQEAFINAAAHDDAFSDEVRMSAGRISEALKSDKFDRVLLSITSAGDPPEMKVGLLKSLKAISLKRGWISEDLHDDLSRDRAKKIDDKKAFYERLTDNINNEKSLFIENDPEYRNVFSGKGSKDKFSKIKEDIESRKKKKKKDDNKPDIDSMSKEEQIYHYSNGIIKSFCDNIEALEPVINILSDANSDAYKDNIIKSYNRHKMEMKHMVSRTNKMIKTGNTDSELIDIIHKAHPKQQFLWGKELLVLHKKEKLEDVFSVISKNREVYDRLIKISRIINNNNADNFLHKSIEKENKLVKAISGKLEEEKLKKLKFKTKSRQGKEKINLFRDLVQLTGSLGDPEKNSDNESVPSSEEPGTNESSIMKDDMNSVEGKAQQARYIKAVSREVNAFIDLYTSERTRQMAVGNRDRLKLLNDFFLDLSNGNTSAVKCVNDNKEECLSLFSIIIKNKLSGFFPSIVPALKYSLSIDLIKRSDL